MESVLVAGATGYLGRYVTRAFKHAGYRTKVLVRQTQRLSQRGRFLEPAIAEFADDVFVADVTKPETLRGVAEGVDLVFSSIGLTRPQPGATFRAIDYQGNLNLLDAVRETSLRKFIYVSVFNGPTFEHVAVIRAHEDFVRALRTAGLPYAVMRPTGFFSDMSEFLRMARSGRVYLLGSGRNRINPIHGADLATLCVRAAETIEAEIPAGGPQVYTQAEIASLAFQTLGRRARITHVPVWLAKTGASLLRPFNRQLGELTDFIVRAGTEEAVAPAHGSHSLAAYYAELAAHWQQSASGSGQ